MNQPFNPSKFENILQSQLLSRPPFPDHLCTGHQQRHKEKGPLDLRACLLPAQVWGCGGWTAVVKWICDVDPPTRQGVLPNLAGSMDADMNKPIFSRSKIQG